MMDIVLYIMPDVPREGEANFDVPEYNTRIRENKLRKEQGLPMRKTPQVTNTSDEKLKTKSDGQIIVK